MEEEKKKVNGNMIIWYFLIFSIIGLFMEMLYGYITGGKLESRKGLIIGPFCPIYGVGAAIFILVLNRYRESYAKLFGAGFLLGSVVEYLLSYALEAIYGNRFWDYSYLNYHLNGRICITYSAFWGILAIVLIRWIKPLIDKLIEKINQNIRKRLDVVLYIFFILDALLTVWAVNSYTEKAYAKFYTSNVQEERQEYIKTDIVRERIFPDQTMEMIFPNLRIYDKEGNVIYIRDIL